MKRHIFQYRYYIIILVALLLVISELLLPTHDGKVPEHIANKIGLAVEEIAQLGEGEIKKSLKAMSDDEIRQDVFNKTSDDYAIAIYKKENLIAWNKHLFPIPLKFQDHKGLIETGKGFFYILQGKSGEFQKQIWIPVYYKFPFNNKYLKNSFPKYIGVSNAYELNKSGTDLSSPLKILGKKEAYVSHNSDILRQQNTFTWSSFLAWIALLFLLIFLWLEASFWVRKTNLFYGILMFAGSLLMLRYISVNFQFPHSFLDTSWFDPLLYAHSEWTPSLGHLLLHTFFILLLVLFIYRKRDHHDLNLPKALINVISFFGMAISLWSLLYISGLLKSLILDSQLLFNNNNLFQMSAQSVAAILVLAFCFLSLVLGLTFVFKILRRSDFDRTNAYSLAIVLGVVFFILAYLLGEYSFLISLWPLLSIWIVVHVVYDLDEKFSFSASVGLLAITAALISVNLLGYSTEKELRNRLLYAEKLASDEDPDTEFKFASLVEKWDKDELFTRPFVSETEKSKTEFDYKIKKEYFSGFWNKYDITFYLYYSDGIDWKKEPSNPDRSQEDLENLIENYGLSCPQTDKLFLVKDYKNQLSYVFRYPIKNAADSLLGILYGELKSKKLPSEIGFPELTIDTKAGTIEELAGYSYARYLDGQIIQKSGAYNYNISPENLQSKIGDKRHIFYLADGFSHLIYRVSPNALLVLGKPTDGILEKATTFSYIFAILSLLIIVLIVLREISDGINISNLSLKSKIQFIIIGLIFSCLVLFGLGIRYYIESQNRQKNEKLISEKIESVHIEVRKKLGDKDDLSEPNVTDGYKNMIMHKFSSVFFTDIHLYDLEGNLIASSNHDLFHYDLITQKMNPIAFKEMVINQRSRFVQKEHIGGMEYLSAYKPFINKEGKTLAYLNLPFFAKQNPLENESYNFIIAIVNIFVVLFALSIVAALFVSNWVTKPLKLLQENVSNIEFGKSNKPIAYTGQDEIGNLVKEYNNKVRELEQAADQLARSERESAWREMAKQVAHEIKNPLTPMKLRIQHFERSFDKNSDDATETIARFSSSLIEQIDALTSIADEFSNFAKMPVASVEEVKLIDILKSSLDLFQEVDSTSLKLDNKLTSEAWVYYDRDQLVRIFNNLIKNALQAIPAEREGSVEVIISQKNDFYRIEVKDNGTGIEPEQRDKIFVPNFTTKSKGMGLGLAMVKNMVQNAGGKIWFETELNEGTSFFVELPVYSPLK